ncbi:MAG: amino acid adenylation domain-containing protein, partial [Thermoguttaceae bacterium]|nr:amino acid adenylation domain-containing protein [Thermoguttaceae bacterium]
FTTLMAGAELYIVPDEIRLDLDKVDEFYCVNGITNGFMTTQVGTRFVQGTRSTTLKNFLVGGEKLAPFAPPKGIRFVNGYGPSETIGYVCSHVVVDDSPIQPIGKPNGNTKLYVVDKSGRLLPPGACGELCVAGSQVGFGYWRRPAKTMKSFVTNPFTDDPVYERMYKTGDVVRLLTSGELDFVGRRDGQVKIRGFRVELAEIEQIVKRFPGVDDATVQAFDDPSGGKFIAAYVVGDEALDVDALNAFIGKEKPSYMIPASTTLVDAIPLNVNGKVDKRRLPAPVRKLDDGRRPETETQRKIFDVVAEVVGTREFGIDVSIYATGLSSIGSIKLCAALAREFDVAIQIKDFKDADTVEKLERLILERVGTEETFDVLPDYPLTKTQEGVFIDSVARPDSCAYNMPLILKLDPRLDDEKLKNAVAETINAHAFLMTVLIADEDGNVRQKRDDALVFSPSEVEVVSVDTFDSIYDELVKPFELLGKRLFRVKLIRAQKGSELYLFFDVWHGVADGTSLTILVADFQKAYSGEKIQRERFTGYEIAALEQRKRQREAYANAIAFYDKLFENVDVDCLPKPDVDPTSAVAGCRRLVLGESEALAKKTLAFCAKNKLSVNSLLCSAFGFTLARYNADDCAVFNTVYFGRNDSRTLHAVSMLVKTTPLVVNVERKTPVGLVREIGKQITDSMAYDVYSYAELSRNYGVKNDVVFVYQGDDFNFDYFCGRPAKRIDPPANDEKAPLTFQVLLKNGKFVFELEYDGALFTEKFVATFASAFDKAVSEFMRCSKLSSASILTSDVEAEMDAFNNTEHVYDASKTVVDLFREQAEKRPNDVAVVYDDVKLTYRELDRVSDKIAAYLVDKGVARDEFVSVLIPRNEYMPIVALGALKSGAAYQPLDPTYPKERIVFMIRDIGARLLIADRGLVDLVGDFRGEILYVDQIASLPDAKPEGVEITPENAFVTIYTSGTTGTPKGSVLEHGAVVCLENYHTRALGIGPGSRVASCASYGFDASVMDIFAALTTGATMHIVPDDVRADARLLEEFFCANKITDAFMTTQLARLFCLNAKCPTLKTLLMGGEKLAPFDPPKNVACYNGYGPSETLAYVTLYRIRNDSAYQPVGRPNANVKLYVVDKYGNRLPFGACGELCVSGRQLARGYFQRPEKTAEVFVPNPFESKPTYERMYHTGEVVRELTDGVYDFVGRRDEQVKVRGFRVELTEIEQIIRKFPGVKDATVQALDNPFGGKYIAAYVVSDDEIDVDKLDAFIGESKPPYMVPATTVRIDEIPTTSNGKVDKRKLPKPERIAKKTGLEPEYAVEGAFCEIFEQVLGLDKVYADDDFFQIGGTSISAVQAVVKADKAGFPVVFKNI